MTSTRIGIANLDLGNLRSVSNALDSLGFDVHFVTQPGEIEDLSHLVIPGVGAFHSAMQQLADRDLVGAVRAYALSGRPLLGLCLGMQVLAASGDEGVVTEGLGLIPGRVVRLNEAKVPFVPHVGWNSVDWQRGHPVTDGVKSGVDFYFVHSYRVCLEDEGDALGSTDCGETIPSVIARDNVIGFQFHPEKSQANGLRLLENFCRWDGRV